MAMWKNLRRRRKDKVVEEQHQESASEEQAPETEEMEETPAPVAEVEEELPAEQEGDSELAALQQELAEARAKESEYLDGWQRARAELANARKRFQREQEQAYTNARADILVRLLPIIDDFERAFETLPNDALNESWIEGMQLIQHKFQGFLEQEGVAAIEAEGQEFDPFLHEAITHEPSTEVPAGHVIGEVQTGYRLGERVLRPSVVRVSAGAPQKEAQSVPEEQVPSAPEEQT
jgi:molecular chaperone GrpE